MVVAVSALTLQALNGNTAAATAAVKDEDCDKFSLESVS